MFITIHCMGMPFNGYTINEKSLGGSETAAYYMAKELAEQGHKVTVFTNHPDEGIWDDVRYVYSGEPSEHEPLGERFHHYAANTPQDVLIVQRLPQAFHFKWAAKVNLLWLHDLALKRYAGIVQSAMHNITGVLTVSEFHKEQVCDVYGLNPDVVHPITNGVDISLYTDTKGEELGIEGFEPDINKKYLIYSSRPERGLENLVKPHGIMHSLWEDGTKDVELLVCGYDNTTPTMRGLYEQLWEACEVLPNVTNLGSLTKRQLAKLQGIASVHVYPTTFEEVSCITAMECMAAGLPFLSSQHAALPETCSISKGCNLIKLKAGEVNQHKFITSLKFILNNPKHGRTMHINQLGARDFYSWSRAAKRLGIVIDSIFGTASPEAIVRHLIRVSDIYAAKRFIDNYDEPLSSIMNRCAEELEECYDFAWQDMFDEHYKAMYVREEERGINYGPEELTGNNRFEQVSMEIGKLGEGAKVMDYGCAHGHYIVNLAKRFPDKSFTGIDIALSNIEKARRWASDEGLTNISFVHGRIIDGFIIDYEVKTEETVNGDAVLANSIMIGGIYDAIIAAEVIEHVATPEDHVDALHDYLSDNGILIITTPYGPWESIGYREHHPWRAHLWHFERADLHELWGHFDNFRVVCAPSGATKEGDIIGSYITTFNKTEQCTTAAINFERKIRECMPRQTLSLCMIVKDAEDSLKRTLDSLIDVVDEVNICIDPSTTDNTQQVISDFSNKAYPWPVVSTKVLNQSVHELGFDEARNESISSATGDWIMWIDHDEYVSYPEHIPSYLRLNGLSGYALKQHHFAIEPLGVMKTDYPCRLFRNNEGIQFFGVVHEHPEKIMNEGIGHAWLIPDVDIAHSGYTNEQIRRKRFDRNIPLMKRDRDMYPDRTLGKFLWIRDLSQLIGYHIEQGMGLSKGDIDMAKEGLRLWDELLEAKQIRMLIDGVGFYSRLVQTLGKGFEVSFKLDTSRTPGRTNVDTVQSITGFFPTEKDATNFITAILNERVKDYGHKYE